LLEISALAATPSSRIWDYDDAGIDPRGDS